MIWSRRQYKALFHDWRQVCKRIHRAKLSLDEKKDTGKELSSEERTWYETFKFLTTYFGEDGQVNYRRPSNKGTK